LGKNLLELKKEEGRMERALKEAEEAFRREKEEEMDDKKKLMEELCMLRRMQEAEGRDESDGEGELGGGGGEGEGGVGFESGGKDGGQVGDPAMGGVEQVNGKKLFF
jgi:hypothetical protein